MNVCVIGLGYIGLPLAAVLARSGHRVRGVDTDPGVIRSVRSGKIPGLEPSLETLAREATSSGSLVPADSVSRSEVFVVAVPTPLGKGHRADLSHVEAAIGSIAPHLEPGNLVVIESTVPVGTTEHAALRLLEKRPDLDSGGGKPSFFLAHCPERVLPGKIFEELVGLDRIVGGIDPESTSRAAAFYSSFVRGSVHCTDVRTAEMCKLVENASRDVSIAFANEISMLCSRMGIDSSNLIRLANRHPRVRIMEPGPGVGGHCIPVDPWFLVESAPRETRLIRSARRVNERKTAWVLEKIREAAARFENPVVACLGLAYKPDVNDLRESPALSIARALCARGTCGVLAVEPHIGALPPGLSRHSRCRLAGLEEALAAAHVVVLLTRHRAFEGIEARLPAGTVFIDPNGTVIRDAGKGKKEKGGTALSREGLEIVGLVPARGGSKGIPGKNLRLLGGRTLVARAVESGLQSRLVNRVILSTDSAAIAEEGKRAGAEVPFLRPAELALDATPTAPVVIHALRWLEENEGTRPDILVLLQPTAPLRQPRHVDEALELLLAAKARSVISVAPVPGHHHPYWQFAIREGFLCPFTEGVKTPPRRQDLPPTYTRNGAIYAAWTEEWLSGKMAYGPGCVPYVMEPGESVNIDSPEDMALAEWIVARAGGAFLDTPSDPMM